MEKRSARQGVFPLAQRHLRFAIDAQALPAPGFLSIDPVTALDAADDGDGLAGRAASSSAYFGRLNFGCLNIALMPLGRIPGAFQTRVSEPVAF
jgi:hypothetical protein